MQNFISKLVNIRCGIGKNQCGIGISDVVSEFFRYVPFPIPHRKLFLTVQCKLSYKYANTLFKFVNLASILKRMKADCHPILNREIFPS